MEKFEYNENEKMDYLAYMFNERTKCKKYENYVVNSIYTKVGNHNLVPVTQQCVKIDENTHYFIDLYFPQLNFAVEVDEGQHNKDENKTADEEREENIKKAIDCTIERIKICEGDPIKTRSFESINADIDCVVAKIKYIIAEKEKSDGTPLKWKLNQELKQEVKQKRCFSTDDIAVYRGINEICEIITGKYPHLQTGQKELNNEYSLWVPRLKEGNKDFYNELNAEKTVITETNYKNSSPKTFKQGEKRIVYMRVKDKFGKDCVKFLRVFEGISKEMHDNDCIRIYKRIATEIKFSDLQ